MSTLTPVESADKAVPFVVRADLGDLAPTVGPYGYANELQAAASVHPGLRRAPLALRLLGLLADHAASTGRAWPSIHRLAERLGSWRDSIRKALRLLARFGFVRYSLQGAGYVFQLPIDPGLRGGASRSRGGALLAGEGGRARAPRTDLPETEPEELTRAADAQVPPIPAPDPREPADVQVAHALDTAALAGSSAPATARAVSRAAENLAPRLGAASMAVVASRLWSAVRDPQAARRLRRASVHAALAERHGWAPEAIGRRFGAVCQGHDLPMPVAPGSEAERARFRERSLARPARAGGGGPAPLGAILSRFLTASPSPS